MKTMVRKSHDKKIENMTRTELQSEINKNHRIYTKFFDRFMDKKIDRDSFLLNGARYEERGKHLRDALGILHGTGDIVCDECHLWFSGVGQKEITCNYQFCSQHRGQLGKKNMLKKEDRTW